MHLVQKSEGHEARLQSSLTCTVPVQQGAWTQARLNPKTVQSQRCCHHFRANKPCLLMWETGLHLLADTQP